MRFLLLFCCLFLLLSCDWLASPESKTQKLVEDELRGLDWNDVDQYPLFDGCDETVSKSEQRSCFENTLLQNLAMHMEDFDFRVKKDIRTTVYIDFLVEKSGEIRVVEMDNDEELLEQLPEFREIIIKSLRSLPKPAPALKRGVPVRSRFRLPLELTTN
ncbi:hypothetical protein [Muriicola soli]|uniref:TonB C-terminal domain-containing protein n=1 Tax=Muriicola soli TaxID=2507538 RepID=A0A411E6U1_9FLAO|nr:hypothetical protein [Muriicola soli]QBA63244.1 hypothetical protein EQY75_00960 [Muriicola soli]